MWTHILQGPPATDLLLAAGADTPNWTDIVEALATAVAALATAATIIFLVFQLWDQQAQTRLQAEQARKGQAEQVVVFMRRDDDTPDGVNFSYSIENRSGRPCYFTYFEVFDGSDVVYVRYGTLDDVPATGTVELGAAHRKPVPGVTPAGTHTWPFYRISFMDAANVFWIRDSLGILTETRSGVPRSWPSDGTFAEKRAHQVVDATGNYRHRAPRGIAPADMWSSGGRVARDADT